MSYSLAIALSNARVYPLALCSGVSDVAAWWRAAWLICWRNPGESTKRRIAAVNSGMLLGPTTIPVTPSITASTVAPANRVATIGNPAAAASTITSPNTSVKEGNSRTSARA